MEIRIYLRDRGLSTKLLSPFVHIAVEKIPTDFSWSSSQMQMVKNKLHVQSLKANWVLLKVQTDFPFLYLELDFLMPEDY